MDVASGSYVGTGVDNRAITGLGFQPKVVFWKRSTTTQMFASCTGMGDLSKPLTATTGAATDVIQSLGADGFTVGLFANASGATYYWVAVGGDDVGVVSYTGNSTDNRNITGLGFQPDVAFILRGGGSAQDVPLMTADSPAGVAWHMAGSTANTNSIQAIISDGVQVGTDATVNLNTVPYFLVGFREVATAFAAISYTGNGSDNRNLNALGLDPVFALVKRESSGIAYRFGSQAGDNSYNTSSQSPAANIIQDFVTGGIQVGTDGSVNANTDAYVGFAIAVEVPIPEVRTVGQVAITGERKTRTVGQAVIAGLQPKSYWSRRFFAARYFAPRYWASGKTPGTIRTVSQSVILGFARTVPQSVILGERSERTVGQAVILSPHPNVRTVGQSVILGTPRVVPQSVILHLRGTLTWELLIDLDGDGLVYDD